VKFDELAVHQRRRKVGEEAIQVKENLSLNTLANLKAANKIHKILIIIL
jgi:hypothetical protein